MLQTQHHCPTTTTIHWCCRGPQASLRCCRRCLRWFLRFLLSASSRPNMYNSGLCESKIYDPVNLRKDRTCKHFFCLFFLCVYLASSHKHEQTNNIIHLSLSVMFTSLEREEYNTTLVGGVFSKCFYFFFLSSMKRYSGKM